MSENKTYDTIELKVEPAGTVGLIVTVVSSY